MAFAIKIGDATAFQVSKANYSKPLNGVSTFEVVIAGSDSTDRAEFDTDKAIEIDRNGTTELLGEVHNRSSFQGGGLILTGFGREVELTEDPAPMVSTARSRVFTATTDNSIIATILSGSSPTWTADVTNSTATTLNSFRMTKSQSRWNAIISLIKQSNKDIEVDQTNRTIKLHDSLGSASQFAFVEGINVGEVVEEKTKPEANTVEVYGKGDGTNQIFGSAGSGNPVKQITDRNIISATAALIRASVYLASITNAVQRFNFAVTNPNQTATLGDAGSLQALSAGVNLTVNVVRVTRGFNEQGTEFLSLEVTDPNNRIASKNLAETISSQTEQGIQARSSMQGSGNENLFGSGINAKTGQSLKIPFFISSNFQDEAGNMNISAINVSYDIDPFNNQVGSASFDGTDPQVQQISDNNDEFSVVSEDDDDVSTGALSNTWTKLKEWLNIAYNGQYITFYIGLYVVDHSDTGLFSVHTRIYNPDTGEYFPNTTGVRLVRGEMPFTTQTADGHTHDVDVTFASSGTIVCAIDPYLYDFEVQFKQDIPGETANVGAQIVYDVESRHKHDPGAYDINAADLDNISISDDIGEASSINASSVNLYLDHYENKAITNNETAGSSVVVEMSDTGNISANDIVYFSGNVSGNAEWATVASVVADTSITISTLATNKSAGDLITWVDKNSVLNTSKTIDQGVDISSSGIYPDATGWWRVRVEPITANADFAQGTVELINYMDN